MKIGQIVMIAVVYALMLGAFAFAGFDLKKQFNTESGQFVLKSEKVEEATKTPSVAGVTETEPQVFSPLNESFSIVMPGQARKTSMTVDTFEIRGKNGLKDELAKDTRAYRCVANDGQCFVTVTTFPALTLASDVELQESLDEGMKNIEAHIEEQHIIGLGHMPGRHVEGKLIGQHGVFKTHAFFDRERGELYTIVALGRAEFVKSAPVNNFFKSFQLKDSVCDPSRSISLKLKKTSL